IVTGATRQQALQRAARALAEFQVEGMATAIPFHRAVVTDPAFVCEPFRVHTRWIETEFVNEIKPYAVPSPDGAGSGSTAWKRLVVEVDGKRLEVRLPTELLTSAAAAAAGHARPEPPRHMPARKPGSVVSGYALASPMQGTIIKVAVEEGQHVNEGDLVVVLEAMKSEQPLSAHCSGTIKGLTAEVGAKVTSGAVICEIRS
ncbi:biotin/lipoyl-containing protein, partial [Streptomyces sp. 8N616]|uniref:biotin/lipoyl-containing protein n=1 Tax=Streptomyces sp. 8N616 TaxID=3457414 RepID=UPI003FD625AB